MIRFLTTGLLLMLLAACARPMAEPPRSSSVMSAPPPRPVPVEMPPPPPPPPPVMASPEMVGATGPADPDRLGLGRRSRRETVRPVRVALPRASSSVAHAAAPAPAPPAEGPNDDGVEQGRAAFEQPPPMEVGHAYTLKFVAGPTDAKIHEETEGRPLTPARDILVARKMKVDLLPNASFTIKPLTEAEQLTGLDKTATWSWEVTPNNADATQLEAKINVYRQLPDGSFVWVEDFDRTVPVTIHVGALKHTLAAIDDASTVGNKLTGLFGTWQKTIAALAALLGALGLLAWKLGLKRTKPEA